MKKNIGIIGGAGVAATNKLNGMLEEYFTQNGAYRDSHHPEIITYQAVNVPSRSMYLEGKGESFIPGYIETGMKLKSIGVDVLCMSCNTAHYAYDEIQSKIGLPFINMVEKTVKRVTEIDSKNKVGLIASDGCLLGKVYEKYFQKYIPEVTIIYPDFEMQREVTRGICNIKNTSRFLNPNHPDRPKQIFKNVCNSLTNSGANVIISGCTDISVDFGQSDYSNILIIDSLLVLAQCIIKEVEEEKV